MGRQSVDMLGVDDPEIDDSGSNAIVRRSKLELQLTDEMVADLRVELHGNLMLAMQAISRFHEVDPDSETPPLEWSREFGIKRAETMHRLALMVHKDTRSAPIGLKIIESIYKTTEGARAAKDAGVVLNTFNITMHPPTKDKPEEIIIDDITENE